MEKINQSSERLDECSSRDIVRCSSCFGHFTSEAFQNHVVNGCKGNNYTKLELFVPDPLLISFKARDSLALNSFQILGLFKSKKPEQKNQLSVSQLESEEGGQPRTRDCAICLSKFRKKSLLRKLVCGHYFHWKCSGRWLRKIQKCPLCRSSVSVEPIFK